LLRRARTLIKLFVKLGTALLIAPAENCVISSPMRLLIQKLFWDSNEGFKLALCVAPQTCDVVYVYVKAGCAL